MNDEQQASPAEAYDYTGDEDAAPDGRLEPDPHHALDFMTWLRPGGPWVLTAIRKESRTEIRTKTFTSESEAAAWIEQMNGGSIDGAPGFSIYYHVNPTTRPLDKKAEREDVAALEFAHVDIDPRVGEDLEAEQERALGLLTERLPQGVPTPTVIIFSGGGYQALWKLSDPFPIDGDLDRAEEAKLWNVALEDAFRADRCHNVDRVLRLPGTINWPDPKKRAKGRVPEFAHVEAFEPDRVYDLLELPKGEGDALPAGRSSVSVPIPTEVRRLAEIDELDQWGVSDRAKALCVHGHLRDVEGPKASDDSRSAWLLDACCQLTRHEVPDEVIYAVITDPDFGISESVLDHDRPDQYAQRQIERAKEMAGDDHFACDDKGRPVAKSQHNIRAALRRLGVRVSHNEFTDKCIVEGLPGFADLTDRALVRLRLTIAREFGFEPPKEWFADVVVDLALHNSFHPVRDYLGGLEWDGTPRADRWLVDYLGAEGSPYSSEIGRLLLVAAVRRVRRPGCKFDEMIVLESPQGMNKSTALRVLAVRDEWFSDDLPLGVEGRVVVERTRGKWIVEAAELKGMRGRRVDQLKSFLSRQHERARLSYDRLEGDHPRHFVIAGTTNDERYLQDWTGNRRFWPVRVGEINIGALRRDRDQLWAEAAHLEAQGGSIRLERELWGAAAEQQAARKELDPWEELLAAALGDQTGKILSEDVWKLVERPKGQRTQHDNNRLGACMHALGWERRRLRHEGANRYFYVRGDGTERDQLLVVHDDGSVSADRLPF